MDRLHNAPCMCSIFKLYKLAPHSCTQLYNLDPDAEDVMMQRCPEGYAHCTHRADN